MGQIGRVSGVVVVVRWSKVGRIGLAQHGEFNSKRKEKKRGGEGGG